MKNTIDVSWRFPCRFLLITNIKELKELKNKLPFTEDHLERLEKSSAVSILCSCEEEYYNIIVFVKHANLNINEIHSVLVHESVHAFDNVMELINESNPTTEMKAYMTQAIAEEMFEQFDKQTKKGRK